MTTILKVFPGTCLKQTHGIRLEDFCNEKGPLEFGDQFFTQCLDCETFQFASLLWDWADLQIDCEQYWGLMTTMLPWAFIDERYPNSIIIPHTKELQPMKASEIELGKYYKAKVSGQLVTVRCEAIYLKSNGQPKNYRVFNLATGRIVIFRTAARFHRRTLKGT